MSAHIRPGYKLTEAGVIPQDWESGSLGRFWDVTDCKHITAEFVSTGGIPVASIREVQSKYIDLDNAKKTTEKYYLSLIEGGRKPQSGDLIMSRNATVGEVAQVEEWHPPFAMGQDVCLLRKKSKNYSTSYLQTVFKSPVIVNQLTNLMVGSTFKRINVEQIRNFSVPMPPVHEQRAIGGILSDMDALISGLDQLIAKKRDIKQATMQQLLSGKQRLPGFSGERVVKRLGDLANIKTGSRNNQDKVQDGQYPFFVRSATVENINSFSLDCEAILVPGEGNIGSIFHYINGRFDVHQRVYAITQFAPDTSGKFVYLYMTMHFGAHAMQNSVKATVDSLRLPTFQSFEITLPPSKDEQSAITTILSDMDRELATLETRRDKARELKLGMMQELLTGRIRLSQSSQEAKLC
ncbi:restriction endonuclease subunit S [Pseudomonas sp. HY13-MNA-CIBAN-0226]|uniref:restriction endonuclease subunit S n=1 Tax=Pseudomonas sp. HY13-MNA-CIBAN-0226 TaxID=3140473 RepID=UPI00332AC7A4